MRRVGHLKLFTKIHEREFHAALETLRLLIAHRGAKGSGRELARAVLDQERLMQDVMPREARPGYARRSASRTLRRRSAHGSRRSSTKR